MVKREITIRIAAPVFLLFLFTSLLYSCKNDELKTGAVVFSFDDQYVDLWYKQRELFNKYNIKATFFINRPQLLQPEQIKKLKELEADGHEIGCHGLNHVNSLNYKDSIDVLIESDIKPAIEILKNYGFDVVSFAYPYGSSTPEIDSALLHHFQYLRKATWNMQDTSINTYNEIFATKTNFRINNAMGIDTNYKITLENLETGLARANKLDEVLVVYAHRIDTTLRDYSIHPKYLEDAFKLCNKNKIQSIRYRDMNDFLSTKNHK
ncbi:polysaccharide deacetylase family protein [uncultured Draconibacterium sp.]|uniref:polysaccharide deacetylase family protein n=1 Tax=uncultured Draconibacterium sp. TaxID=1573823 RepID=UPI003216C21C